jgi:hypothetical protein
VFLGFLFLFISVPLLFNLRGIVHVNLSGAYYLRHFFLLLFYLISPFIYLFI